MITASMRRLLDVLEGTGVDAYGVAHPNGSVHITLKGDPDTVEEILHRWQYTLLAAVDEEER